VEPPDFSPQYNFVRARQLEGTFSGDRSTGTWPITGGRISYGWGAVPEEVWPYDTSVWPPIEPPGVDAVAKRYRGGRYQRVRTLEECKTVLGSQHHPLLVLVSLEITDRWFRAPGGRIPSTAPNDVIKGCHFVVLYGYDDHKGEFAFRNSWGAQWGNNGNGFITYSTFEATWVEGWLGDIPAHWYNNFPTRALSNEHHSGVIEHMWAVQEHGGGVFHCHEFVDHSADERIGWAFAIERQGALEVEELFVRPQFRRKTYGKRLMQSVIDLASGLSLPLKIWVSFADMEPANLRVIEGLIQPHGLSLSASGERWAALVGERSERV
jgi:GNAT superfamily N-acetyltransferase